MTSAETYWLITAPAMLFGLSLIGWAALWLTARSATLDARHELADVLGP